MAVIPIIVRTRIERPLGLSARKHNAFSREAHREMGEAWQREVLPQRFTPGARYPHRARSSAWLRQKVRAAARGKALFGGLVTNVFTGAMMRKLLGEGRVRGFPSRVSITKTGTRYIDMRVWKANQPDKWAELSTLKRGEAKLLSRTFRDAYVRQVKADRSTVDHQAK